MTMGGIEEPELLDLWERGRPLAALERGELLLGAACPGTPAEELSRLSIGRRDACLLRLRELTFGPDMRALTKCPGCAERLELQFGTSDILVDESGDTTETAEVKVEGYGITVRAPNTLDLRAVSAARDLEKARRDLIERCVVAAVRGTTALTVDELPEGVLAAAVERMEGLDPQAEVDLSLECPSCRHASTVAFDIASYFWEEIASRAKHLLHEIDVLARVYGWSEGEVLALSPGRRQAYLDLVAR